MRRKGYDLKGGRKFGRATSVTVISLMITLLVLNLFAINAQSFSLPDKDPIIGEDMIRVRADFSTPVFTKVDIDGESYDRITVNGLRNAANPGEPVLPVKTLKVLIPMNKKIVLTSIEYDAMATVNGTYLIEPCQRQAPLRDLSGYEVTIPDEDIYESGSAFPEDPYRFITLQKLSGYKIAVFNLYPVTYYPKEGVISYYKDLTMVVHLSPADEVMDTTRNRVAFDRGNMQIIDRIRGFVDNADIESTLSSYHDRRYLPTGTSHNTRFLTTGEYFDLTCNLPDTGPYEYIIITDEGFEDPFTPLIDSKTKRGITARIVTTQWIYENYDGTRPDGGIDEQTKIRNFIRDAHAYWGTQYILLGGDADSADLGWESEDVIVPCRILYETVYGEDYPDEANIASDLYYACLDGTFDYNQNGIYGEVDDGEDGGEVDLLAEVFVGRAPVDSVEEVVNFVKKTLKHEESIPSVWKNKMVGEDMTPLKGIAKYALNYLEEIRLGSNKHGYSTTGIEASSIQSHVLYDSPDYKWKPQMLIDSMNSSGTHYYNHLGHSDLDYNMKLTSTDVDLLSNKRPFFVYSQGCYSASFDNMGVNWDPDESPTKAYDHDSIAEHFVNHRSGAFAYIGNTRYGWGVHDSTDGASQHFHRYFWDAVIGQGIKELGRANQKSKEDNIGFILYDDPVRWCYFQIVLLGDPEISIGNFMSEAEKPSEPVNLFASEGTYNNEVYLTWNHNQDATNYLIFRNEKYDSESASCVKSVAGSELDNYLVQYMDNSGKTGKTNFYWVKSYNGNKTSGFSRAYEVFIHTPPVANAGDDQTKTVKSRSDKQNIDLDGSGSYDPERGTLTYEWSIGGRIISTEAKTTLMLGVGVKSFTLRVSNGLKSSSDTMTIRVEYKLPDMFEIINGNSRRFFGDYFGYSGGFNSQFPGFGGYYNSYSGNSFENCYYSGFPGGYTSQGFSVYNHNGFLGCPLYNTFSTMWPINPYMGGLPSIESYSGFMSPLWDIFFSHNTQ